MKINFPGAELFGALDRFYNSSPPEYKVYDSHDGLVLPPYEHYRMPTPSPNNSFLVEVKSTKYQVVVADVCQTILNVENDTLHPRGGVSREDDWPMGYTADLLTYNTHGEPVIWYDLGWKKSPCATLNCVLAERYPVIIEPSPSYRNEGGIDYRLVMERGQNLEENPELLETIIAGLRLLTK